MEGVGAGEWDEKNKHLFFMDIIWKVPISLLFIEQWPEHEAGTWSS